MARLGVTRSVGMHVMADRVHAAFVDRTPLGMRPGRAESRPLAGRAPALVMQEVLQHLLADHRGAAVVSIGVPASAIHHRAVRISPAPSRRAMQSLDLLASLLPPGWSVRDSVVRLTRFASRFGTPFQVTAAARAALDPLRLPAPRPEVTVRHEPAPLAFLRVSLGATPPAGGSGLELRVCDGPGGGIGYLLDGTHALAWLEAQPTEAATALEAVATQLAALARSAFGTPVAAVTVQGTAAADLARLGAAAGGVPAWLVAGPAFDAPIIAHGLALREPGDDAGDLEPPRDDAARAAGAGSAWWLTCALAGMIALMIGMDARAQILAAEIALVRARQPVRALTLAELHERRRWLTDLVLRCGHFVDRPVSWATVVERIARAVPEAVAVASIECAPPRFDPTAGRARAEYSVKVTAPERELLLESVMSDPFLRRTFPEVDVSRDPSAVNGPPLYILTAAGSRAPGTPTAGASPAPGAPRRGGLP